VAAVTVLATLLAIAAWNRLSVDPWLARVDVVAFFLPWYAVGGDRLVLLDVPGWNPHAFSDVPFAGDPESGWWYLPVMLFFPLLPAVAVFEAMVVFQLAVAAFSTYAFARVVGLGTIASLAAAVVFAFGPFLHHDT
jgi:hypothetical protein